MAERGRLYRWPRNRSFGDTKPRPVLVIAPDAATSRNQRWVVLPLSSDPRLAGHPFTVPLEAGDTTGLEQPSWVMAWLPTTVDANQLDGPMGRVGAECLRSALQCLYQALDLAMEEPYASP